MAPHAPSIPNPPILALVVEDNQDFAQLVSDILELEGCLVQTCYNGTRAIQLLEAFRPHIIFCDLHLPGTVDGLQLARHVRSTRPISGTPLVAITGYASDDDRARAVDAGFNAVFPKPFKYAHLREALLTYVGPRKPS